MRTAVTRAGCSVRPVARSQRLARGRWLLAIVLLCASCLLIGAAPTFASTGHNFVSSLTDADGAALIEPTAVAVDQVTGEVFVADVGAGVVDVYSASGSYLTHLGEGSLLAGGIAVDEASGLVYVADSFENAILVFKSNGAGSYGQIGEWAGEGLSAGAFGEVTGVAVDNSKSASSGDVYVVDGEDLNLSVGVVDVFKPNPPGREEGSEGSLVRMLSKGKLEEPNGIAIDPSSGRVYVADSAKGLVYEFGASGAAEGKLNGSSSPLGSFAGREEAEGNVSAVAVDPTSGDLLVAESEAGVVSEFNAAGEWDGWISSTESAPVSEPRGVAVTGSGTVYVGDGALARVDLYAPGVAVPDVMTMKASKVTRTSATLSGTLNGEGEPGHYFFQWGETPELGTSTAPTVFPGGEEPVAATLTELHANSTYYFRLVAEGENGASYGATKSFTTPTAVEGLSTGPVMNLQSEGATLTGSLSPNGLDTHYYFQWGTSTAYGNTSPEPPGTDAGLGDEVVKAETPLSGLAPNTVYHYRLVGENQLGTTFGADQTFQTSGPPRITSKPVTGVGHETATLNAEVNPGELTTTYHFEYGETTEYGTEVPLGGASIGSGATPVHVSATLSSLKLGVTYHYRVIATNSDTITTGPDQTFTTIPPALITSSAVEVRATEATLNATIDPLGHDTTYYFQYGTAPCASDPEGCTSSPTPPGEDIGSGEELVAKTLSLTGLTPDTTYYYRVVAINSLGTSEGAEQTITTPKPVSSFALPDGRAWEMVSPPDKGAAPVEALTREGGVILASEDGSKLTYVVDGALGEAEGNRSPEWQQVLATRGATSWSSQDIATPNSKATGVTAGQTPEYQYFSADLSTALVEPAGAEPFLAAGVTHPTPYLRDNTTGTYVGLVTAALVTAGSLEGTDVTFVGASPDLSHVVIEATAALTGPGSAAGLYEGTGDSLAFVTALPGTAAPARQPELGFRGRVVHNAVSTDGTRVIWTNRAENAGGGHLYLRDMAKGETLQLDAAEGVVEPVQASAEFQGATPDGSEVFFTDKQRLTADSTAEPKFPEKADLYECTVVEEAGKLACRLKDLTVDSNEGEHAAVQGFAFGTGEAGADVYFVAQGVLASNANGNGERGVPGGENLYGVHFDGSQWSTRFIATLSPADSAEWEGADLADTAYLTARVSPNGRYLAFMSEASPTGYDNVDANPEAKGARDEEVYLYDSATASLTCVSCDPTGARPAGVLDHNEAGEGLGLLVDRRKVWAERGKEHWLAGNIPGWTAENLTSALYQSRYLLDDGRLFFNSPDDLVPQASNGKEDVYEYEPAGVGSCESATGGCVSLISSGTSAHESAFIEATPSGSDVFFVTEANLLPQDTDTAFDIYDARECTALSPCLTVPAAPPEPCAATETCRPASSPVQAPAGPAGSASFSGPGNIPPPPARAQVQGAKTSKPAAKPLTRKQRLASALRLCRQKYSRSKHKRTTCEAHARRLYGAGHARNSARRAQRYTADQTTRRTDR
jgi:DNA-binding beta-propeller fold protein YncE